MLNKMKEPKIVRLQSARLDDKEGDIVAHGWLDLEALLNLKVGDYQREVMHSVGRKSTLMKGAEAGDRFPDIMLGMRGQKYTSKGQDMLLEDDVYIVDGLQRVSALKKYAENFPDKVDTIRIGAEVRFGTNSDSETTLFEILNTQRKAMSPSVVLRNKRSYSDALATLYGLSLHDRNFCLVGRVCWNQQMHRGELMTALTFAKVALTLHRSIISGGKHLSNNKTLVDTLDRACKAHGLQNFRNNIAAYFEMLEDVWGIRGIKYRDQMIHMKGNFLVQFGAVIADHEDFWDGNKLVFDKAFRTKMRSFPVDDPTIQRLSGAGIAAGAILRRLMIDHINKNKQFNRHLKLRQVRQYHKKTTKAA